MPFSIHRIYNKKLKIYYWKHHKFFKYKQTYLATNSKIIWNWRIWTSTRQAWVRASCSSITIESFNTKFTMITSSIMLAVKTYTSVNIARTRMTITFAWNTCPKILTGWNTIMFWRAKLKLVKIWLQKRNELRIT